MRYCGYEIEKRYNHYVILQDDTEILTVDTVAEAKDEIDYMENEYTNCMQESLASTGQWW